MELYPVCLAEFSTSFYESGATLARMLEEKEVRRDDGLLKLL